MKKILDLIDKHLAWAIFIFSLILYYVTMAPTVIWGDSANFALMVDQFMLDPAADGHPLYIILGKIFSWLPGELAVNLNFMSVFFGALAVTFVYLVSLRITKSKTAGALGALAFSLSHSFWLHAVVSEVYTLNAFFLLAVIYLLLKWKEKRRNNLLYWGAFVYGLALSNHLVIGFFGVAILYFLATYDYKIFTDRRFFIILACFLLGLSVYLGVLLKWMIMLPEKTGEIADIAAGRGQHRQHMLSFNISWTLQNIKMYFAYLFYQFPLLGLGLGIAGLVYFLRFDKKLALFFLLTIGVNACFFIVGPQTFGGSNYTFYIQDYAIFSILIAYCCHHIIQQREQKFVLTLFLCLLLMPLITYQLTPVMTKKLGIDLLRARKLPYRDNEVYFLNPSKLAYYGPREYAQKTFEALEPEATIIADYTPAAVLEYYQKILGVRPDVKMHYVQEIAKAQDIYDLKPFVDENYEKGPIYLADLAGKGYYNIENLEKEYQIIPVKPIYKVIKVN